MELLDYAKRKNQSDILEVMKDFQSGKLENGAAVTLKGTIYRIKEMSGFAFVNIRSSCNIFQCVWDAEKSDCNIKEFSPEESVLIDGFLVKEERSNLGFDIFIRKMTRISGRAETLPIEISNDRKVENLNLNTLLDQRFLAFRNAKTRAIFKISDGVLYAFRTFLRGEGFTEFVPPKLVETGAEDGAELELFLGKGQMLPDLTDFPTIRFVEAKELFSKAHIGLKGQQALKETDLSPEEEKWLGAYFNKEYHTPLFL